MPNGPEGERRQADRSECAVPACRIATGDGRAACGLPNREKALVRRRKRAGAGATAGWGVTGLLMLSLGGAAHAQAPSPADEEAVAEAVAALREWSAEPGLPESAEAAETRSVQARETCRMIPNPTARAICTSAVALAVALDVGIPTVIDWLSEDAEAMNQESQEILDRFGAVEDRLDALEAWRESAEAWRESADNRFSEMNGKLDLIIELLRSR